MTQPAYLRCRLDEPMRQRKPAAWCVIALQPTEPLDVAAGSGMTAPALDRRSCLYHYTSATGLESGLRQRFLRATDTGFLNDLKEIIYAAEPLIPRMNNLLEIVAAHDADHDPGKGFDHQYAIHARRYQAIHPP